MKISIAERLRPFSHVPGTLTILSGWGCLVQIFPCLIRLSHLHQGFPRLLTELTLDLKGPIEQFTICNDLEKGRLTVSGMTSKGWIRYHLISAQNQEEVRFFLDRAPSDGISLYQKEEHHLLREKEGLDLLKKDISAFEAYQVPICSRLSLGNHKAQDWELIKRRLNFAEIFPLLHRLGQFVPSFPIPESREGTLSLLEDCRNSIINERPEKGEEKWRNFLLGCFDGLLMPQLQDLHYQGIVKNPLSSALNVSPLVILSEGARLIQELFIRQEHKSLLILPHLLPCLPYGRLVNIPLEEGGWISFEWTKKTIRRLILYAGRDQELLLRFRSYVRSYRLRQNSKEKGERKNHSSLLLLKKNCHYFFDNFQ